MTSSAVLPLSIQPQKIREQRLIHPLPLGGEGMLGPPPARGAA
jgi:hypothetical protein